MTLNVNLEIFICRESCSVKISLNAQNIASAVVKTPVIKCCDPVGKLQYECIQRKLG